MDIRFVSSLTPEDENLFAGALLKAVGALLDQLPIAYTLRIETTDSKVFQCGNSTERDGSHPQLGEAAVRTHAYLAASPGLPRG